MIFPCYSDLKFGRYIRIAAFLKFQDVNMGYCISRKKTGKENSQYLGYRALHKLMFVG